MYKCIIVFFVALAACALLAAALTLCLRNRCFR